MSEPEVSSSRRLRRFVFFMMTALFWIIAASLVHSTSIVEGLFATAALFLGAATATYALEIE